MDSPFEKRCYRLPKQQIATLRFTLESYDGLAFVRTLAPREAVVEIAWPPSRSADAEALLAALEQECEMVKVPRPQDYTPL
ncbi:DUF4911 domain-containing protein [uncultured Desulfuromonas sp.]|mgnify:CR=1 FL=1|uniref:DUF4911 domain-containing protein n=1 Tax=uncultured Desulfuromonas sp. TaxID=181013 RepID=UPI00260E9016|nr:DUF4911 domain-containing protein [uncultured Desulfuromonas sp.]